VEQAFMPAWKINKIAGFSRWGNLTADTQALKAVLSAHSPEPLRDLSPRKQNQSVGKRRDSPETGYRPGLQKATQMIEMPCLSFDQSIARNLLFTQA
jgi:hypothetical protein